MKCAPPKTFFIFAALAKLTSMDKLKWIKNNDDPGGLAARKECSACNCQWANALPRLGPKDGSSNLNVFIRVGCSIFGGKLLVINWSSGLFAQSSMWSWPVLPSCTWKCQWWYLLSLPSYKTPTRIYSPQFYLQIVTLREALTMWTHPSHWHAGWQTRKSSNDRQSFK